MALLGRRDTIYSIKDGLTLDPAGTDEAPGPLSEEAQDRLNSAMAQKRDGEPVELARLTARLTELIAGAPN